MDHTLETAGLVQPCHFCTPFVFLHFQISYIFLSTSWELNIPHFHVIQFKKYLLDSCYVQNIMLILQKILDDSEFLVLEGKL